LTKRDIIFTSQAKNKYSMQKIKNKIYSFSVKSTRLTAILAMIAALGIGSFTAFVHAASCSSAASCQAQINSLNSQSSTDKSNVGALEAQQESYQSTIDSLNAQMESIRAQLGANETKQAGLQTQITANDAEIVTKKATLSDDIKTMYVNGQMSTIEELATSKDLSDFVDKQQYRSVVEDQLNDIITQINTLQAQLQTEQSQVNGLISTEQSQNSQLAASQAQEQALLGYNQSQQAAYNSQIASAASSVNSLKAQLTALNNAGTSSVISGGTCGGGYPTKTPSGTDSGTYWGCDEPQDNTTDNWNMDNRECVSYTAFIASTKYGVSTSNWGNAYQWITAAESHGFTVDQTPSVGAIAIRDRDYGEAGDVGHAMYVVAVNGSDSITVDEYNEHYDGTFDERTFSPSSYDSRGGLYYIHL
jgi:surface antigen